MSKTVAIIQARTSSSRLPGKVLMPLAGRPALARVVERVRGATLVDEVVVATSEDPSDDRVETLAREIDVRCVRGSLADVLARFEKAARETKAEVVVRITADCPLHDGAVIDDVVRAWRGNAEHVRYVSNVDERTYPDGLDAEVFPYAALEDAARKATAAFDHEHVTPWIRRSERKLTVWQSVDLQHLRWTLDRADDYETISWIWEQLGGASDRARFTSADVYRLLVNNPSKIQLGSGVANTDAERERHVALMKQHLARNP